MDDKKIETKWSAIFAKNLSALKEENGYSIEELASSLEVDTKTVFNWLKNVKVPQLDSLFKIANYFNVSVVRLISAN